MISQLACTRLILKSLLGAIYIMSEIIATPNIALSADAKKPRG
jgi:hypothetical protein